MNGALGIIRNSFSSKKKNVEKYGIHHVKMMYMYSKSSVQFMKIRAFPPPLSQEDALLNSQFCLIPRGNLIFKANSS